MSNMTTEEKMNRKLKLAKAKAKALLLLQKQNQDKKTTTTKPKKNIVSSSRQAILDMPVRNIFTDEKRFQNRKNAFSEESSNRIINAVNNGSFDWAKFDPIIVWRDDKKQRYFVLSGHSRLAAFRELSKTVLEFEEIPVKIFKGTEESAIELALTSNTLSTKETDVERSIYWANRRERCEIKNGLNGMNVCEKEIFEEIRETEGRNSNFILNLSYLNSNGFLIENLMRLGADKDNANTNTYRTIANWIGEARRKNNEINDIQETEIAKFLLNGGYGNKKHQFSNKTKFNERLQYSFDKWKKNGANLNKPLNLANTLSKSSFEQEYDIRYERAKRELNEAKELHTEKYNKYLNALIDGKISQERMDELMIPHVIAVQKATAEVKRIQGRKNEVSEATKSQTALFGLKFMRVVGVIGFHIANQLDIESAGIIVNEKSIKHIIDRHSKELDQLGISAMEYVKLVVDNYNEIRQGKKSSLFLVVKGLGKSNTAIIELTYKYFEEHGKAFYLVNTATPMRSSYLKKKKLLWQKERTHLN